MGSIQHGYLPRVADKVLARKLKSSGAVQIKGPKWCGKTATAEQAAASSQSSLKFFISSIKIG